MKDFSKLSYTFRANDGTTVTVRQADMEDVTAWMFNDLDALGQAFEAVLYHTEKVEQPKYIHLTDSLFERLLDAVRSVVVSKRTTDERMARRDIVAAARETVAPAPPADLPAHSSGISDD